MVEIEVHVVFATGTEVGGLVGCQCAVQVEVKWGLEFEVAVVGHHHAETFGRRASVEVLGHALHHELRLALILGGTHGELVSIFHHIQIIDVGIDALDPLLGAVEAVDAADGVGAVGEVGPEAEKREAAAIPTVGITLVTTSHHFSVNQLPLAVEKTDAHVVSTAKTGVAEIIVHACI